MLPASQPAGEATASTDAPADKLLSTREAAELLGVSTKHLEQMRGRGEGPPHKRIGRSRRALP
ncbi:MAG: helix-turn-helix domain-containing protein, partial [Polyangiaceae bacterium]